MSIASDMKVTDVFNPASAYDKYGRPNKNKTQFEEEPCMTIEVAINIQTNYTSNKNVTGDVRYGEVTHLGLTTCRELVKGQKLIQDEHQYIIDLVPNTRGRLTQIYLKEIEGCRKQVILNGEYALDGSINLSGHDDAY